jgi:hypothetical protein
LEDLDEVVEQLEAAEDRLLRWIEENPPMMRLPDMPELLRQLALAIAAARVVQGRFVAGAGDEEEEKE